MDEALREEERRLRMLRFVVDLNQAILVQQRDLTLREAFDILKSTRQAARNLFPDKEDEIGRASCRERVLTDV